MKHELYNRAFYDKQSKESYESARVVLSVLQNLLEPGITIGSVADFGCGVGSWLAAAQDIGVSEIFGTDGDYVPRDRLMIDADSFYPNDLSKPKLISIPNRKFDLAMSLEVAEHLEEKNAAAFIELLTEASDLILFSAAIPYQGGHGHVNENWFEYWERKFADLGYVASDILRPYIWDNEDVCWWYKQNIVVFINATKLPTLPRTVAIRRPLNAVHPQQYLVAVHREKTQRHFSYQQDVDYFQNLRSDQPVPQVQTYGREYSYVEQEESKIESLTELMEYAESSRDAVLLDALSPVKEKEFDLDAFKQTIKADFNSPDFICVGDQESGTTWLYEVLRQQKTVWLPPLKELNFFNQLVLENDSAYSGWWRRETAVRLLHEATKDPNLSSWQLTFLHLLCQENVDALWYSRIFRRCPKLKISGEITPEYMMLPISGIKAIKAINPNVKIIFMLREPAQRNQSHVNMIKQHCPQIGATLETDLLALPSVTARANYSQIMDNWESVFESKQLHTIDFELIRKNPKAVFAGLSEFLGVKLIADDA